MTRPAEPRDLVAEMLKSRGSATGRLLRESEEG